MSESQEERIESLKSVEVVEACDESRNLRKRELKVIVPSRLKGDSPYRESQEERIER